MHRCIANWEVQSQLVIDDHDGAWAGSQTKQHIYGALGTNDHPDRQHLLVDPWCWAVGMLCSVLSLQGREREILFWVLASAKDKTAWLLSATRRRTGVRNKLDKHYCLTGIVGVGPGRKTDSDQDSDSAVCNGFQSVNCDRFISYQSIALLLDSGYRAAALPFCFFNYFVPHTSPCPGSNMPVLHHHLTFGRQSDETMMICLAVWLSGPQKANSWMVLACELLAVILQNTPTSALHKLGIFERKEFWRW